MRTRSVKVAVTLVGALISTVGCNDGPTGPEYAPQIPSAFVGAVTNPYFPLTPGTTYSYESLTGDGFETITVEVLQETRIVMGVPATVVRDRVYLDGELIEDTRDWYAQDAAGNVWYLGEDAMEIENGQVVSTEGSWEWGVEGALPGIIMWGDPAAHLDEAYRQEYYRGHAEDWGKVVALDQAVQVPYGSFTGCIETEDWNGLEAGTREHKFYCPQVGVALEVMVQGGDERVELVSVTTP